jgi:hypothetical protein
MGDWRRDAVRRYRQHKYDREEFWDDLWAIIFFVIFHPILAFKKARKVTLENVQ